MRFIKWVWKLIGNIIQPKMKEERDKDNYNKYIYRGLA